MRDDDAALTPILRAARESVEYHGSRSYVEYPGYIWIDWEDLVCFVEAARRDGRVES